MKKPTTSVPKYISDFPQRNISFFCWFYVLSILLIPLTLPAFQNYETSFPLVSTGQLKFDVDICQFEDGSDSTRLEILYSVYLIRKEAKELAKYSRTTLNVHFKLTDQSGNVLKELNESRKISLYDSLNPSKFTTYIDLLSVRLIPGIVSMQMTISDSTSGRQGSVAENFTIREFSEEFSLSDLYFVSHVQRATGASIFEKHGVMLVPHPSRIFFVSDSMAKMYVFYEINNLSYIQERLTFYTVNINISDMSGNEMFSSTKEMLKVTGENASRVEVIQLGGFDNGIYNLHVEVLDVSSDLKRQIKSHFQVIREGSDRPDLLPMSESEEKKYFDQIKYVASRRELYIYNQLNPQGKQQFLLQFWKSRDPDPTTPVNEFMVEHFRRMSIAEQSFRGGINSNMGRIYIQYGPPVDVERQTFSAGSSQLVEIWTYTIRGRTEFVFVDLRGDGEYFLVHSNHPDEYQNPDWEEDLK